MLQPDHIEKGYVPRIAGERLPATYINHYTANGGAVVPQFGFNAAGADERALEDIYKAYNGERKVGFNPIIHTEACKVEGTQAQPHA